VWSAWWRSGYSVRGLAIHSTPVVPLSDSNLGQVVRAHVPLFTKQYKAVPAETTCGWEGNRGPGGEY